MIIILCLFGNSGLPRQKSLSLTGDIMQHMGLFGIMLSGITPSMQIFGWGNLQQLSFFLKYLDKHYESQINMRSVKKS